MDWKKLADRILDGGEPITRAEALAVLESGDGELLEVLQATYRIRQNWFGRKVSLLSGGLLLLQPVEEFLGGD